MSCDQQFCQLMDSKNAPLEGKNAPLEGKRVAITGTLSLPRKDIITSVEALGGRIDHSVSKNTCYLIAADNHLRPT